MFSLNKVSLIGNVGKAPEIKDKKGNKMAFFSLATTESWKDKDSGEYKNKTEWHKIAVYNPNLVKIIENNIIKGSKIYIEGNLAYRTYTNESGIEKEITEIVINNFNGKIILLDKKEVKDNPDEEYTIKTKAKKDNQIKEDE